MRIPKTITSGDTVVWDDVATEDAQGNAVTSTDWTLRYYIRGRSITALNLLAVANGSGWRTTLSGSDANIPAGDYFWEAKVTKSSLIYTIGAGQLKVLPNLSTESGANFDARSQARKDLDAIQLAIRTYGTNAVAEYTIRGRQLRKMPLPDLLLLESRYLNAVNKEEKQATIDAGKGNPHNLRIRFKS